MRPRLKPAVRVLWRDAATVQFGVDARSAVAVTGVDPCTAALFDALDGSRTDAELRVLGRQLGLDASSVDRLLDWLRSGRLLDDAARRPAEALLPRGAEDLLTPDLAALSLLSEEPDGGAVLLERRRAARISVVGAGRVGATVATLLAAAGIGRVVPDDPEPATAADCAPGGLAPADAGTPRGDALRRRLLAVNPAVQTAPPTDGDYTLQVLAPPGPFDATVGDAALRGHTPHLLAFVRDLTGVIGPLVSPGRSPCLRCLEAARAARDPRWPLIAAQLASDPPRKRRACDVVLATLVAAIAALQVLAFVDGRRPATVGATVEMTLPDWRFRRRRWSMHPDCGCGWPSNAEPDAGIDPGSGRGIGAAPGGGVGPGRAVGPSVSVGARSGVGMNA
ncbi:UBA/THIF-type NAD/FAD binding protein [Acidothermus cellulolyticus 11B]|uniref:UBA/THIF-type NAD/FAD binding protein n=1 Tax=Acidothermus cellulolyticus (strain ATCC 43068 / DSM 8971 / 11B) TaxID=351607 RepID=A0LVT0_ACIC1|nr:TOMM precursor leader peptide-binding protein [Acidothermus cellulolyticus]ABK53540.1 UBA/THIF-type NAD/FAD binding protein [Acidothermus cellulolyticus 11B]